MTNIKFDFRPKTEIDQPLAIMPAAFAEKLLRQYANNLTGAYFPRIQEKFVEEVRATNTVEELTAVALNFINERALIDAINSGNLDLYKVEENKPGPGESLEAQLAI